MAFSVVYVNRHTLYRQILLSHVAHAAVGDATGEAAAIALFEKVTELAAIRPDGPDRRRGGLAPPSVVIDDDPASTLIRGFGYCDSTAMALVQVAERAGFKGRLVFLLDENGGSPHSVAALQFDGEWRVFDTLTHRFQRNDAGQIATFDDIASGRAPATSSRWEASWFGRPEVFYETRPPTGVRQRVTASMRAALGFFGKHAGGALSRLYLMTPPPDYVTTEGTVFAGWDEPGDISFWRARNHHVVDRAEAAMPLYERALRLGTTHEYEARFFLQHLP